MKHLDGTLFIYGHSIAENDYHLYNAIFESNVDKLFVCVHRPEDNLQNAKEKLAQFRERNDQIEVIYVDSATVQVW